MGNRPGLIRDNPKTRITYVGDAAHGGRLTMRRLASLAYEYWRRLLRRYRNAHNYVIDAKVLRNRANETMNNTTPIIERLINWGQTTSNPAPR